MTRQQVIEMKERTFIAMTNFMEKWDGNIDVNDEDFAGGLFSAALHQACCLELGYQVPGSWICQHDQRAILERCVERLTEYVGNVTSPTSLVESSLADLRRILEGGGT